MSATDFQQILDAMTRAPKPPVICRRCGSEHDPLDHTLSDCERIQIDKAMLADKQRNGYQTRSDASAMKFQQQWEKA